jgi:microcystin-dependent protein
LRKLGLNAALTAADTSNGFGVLKFASRLNLPNLTDRFVVGAGNSYAVGNTGGQREVTLTADQIPSHKHSFKDYYHAEAYDTIKNESYSGASVVSMPGPAKHYGAGKTDVDANAWLAYIHSTENAGGNVAHPNMPPYYALYYLIKMI